MESIQLSAYDFVVFGLVLLLVGRGIWLGFLRQITPLLALYVGYIVASRYHDQLFPFLSNISDNPKVVFLTAYVILFAATYLVATLFGKGLAKVMELTVAPWFDRLLGAALGLAKALLVVILLHMILGTLMAPENEMLRNCQSCPTLNQLSETARKIIKDEDIREALRQRQPAIAIDAVQDIFMQEAVPPEESGYESDPQEMLIAPEEPLPVE